MLFDKHFHEKKKIAEQFYKNNLIVLKLRATTGHLCHDLTLKGQIKWYKSSYGISCSQNTVLSWYE